MLKRKVLTLANTETGIETILGLVELDQAGELNYNPEYQRKAIWSTETKRELIHSIFDQMPIGIFYLNRQPDGTLDFIDGQQRTRAIIEFGKNKYNVVIGGKSKYCSDLSEEEEDIFYNYPLHMNISKGVDDEFIRMMYIRINSGVPLTTGERCHAINSYLRRRYIENWKKHPIIQKFKYTRVNMQRRFQLDYRLLQLFTLELDSIGERHKRIATRLNPAVYLGILHTYKKKEYILDTLAEDAANRVTQVFDEMLTTIPGRYIFLELSTTKDILSIYALFSNIMAQKKKVPRATIRQFLINFFKTKEKVKIKRDRNQELTNDEMDVLAYINKRHYLEGQGAGEVMLEQFHKYLRNEKGTA